MKQNYVVSVLSVVMMRGPLKAVERVPPGTRLQTCKFRSEVSRGLRCCLILILLFSCVACGQEGEQVSQEMDSKTSLSDDLGSIHEKDSNQSLNASGVIAKYRKKVMAIPGVEGMALGACPKRPDVHCIIIYSPSGTWPDGLPRQLDGYDVVIKKVSGGFRPL